MKKNIALFCTKILQFEKVAITLLRIGIAIVLIWIGGLKFIRYEAEGITPFVSNSPFMSFFYNNPQEYSQNKHKEGQYVEAHYKWHVQNNTYGFSYGLGTLLVSMGILLLLNYIHPIFGLIGAILVFIMGIGTLSFLVTTPETWVTDWAAKEGMQGPIEHGFPYLSGAGRLVLKDIIMWGGAWVVGIDSAKKILQKCTHCKKQIETEKQLS